MASLIFENQIVRDLSWAISSPPIVSQAESSCLWPDKKWYQDIYQESQTWLRKVDKDPSELECLLANQNDKRMGKYFETLWLYWFMHHPRYEVLANNLQIIIDGETLGEIDFIVYDKNDKKTIHWEVAVKFYLGVGDTSDMRNWHGPNLCDRLDKKVHHLLERQSMVGKSQRVEDWLSSQNLHIDSCAVILKGRLYYPWLGTSKQSLKNLKSPEQCSSGHLKSWWFKKSQFNAVFDDKQKLLPLIKKGWMERVTVKDKEQELSKRQIFNAVSDNCLRFPLQVQVDDFNDWDKIFIVQESWEDKIA